MTEVLPRKVDPEELPPDPLLIIEVTEEDISRGCTRDTINCPIARAAARSGLHSVSVGTGSIGWRDNRGLLYRSDLPSEARRFIRRFDNQLPGVTPFAFTVVPTLDTRKPSDFLA